MNKDTVFLDEADVGFALIAYAAQKYAKHWKGDDTIRVRVRGQWFTGRATAVVERTDIGDE